MRPGEQIRYTAFWIRDILGGAPIRKNLNDISFMIEKADAETAGRMRDQRINDLLEHASGHVRFYSRFKAATRLEDFPVVNKSLIKENFDDFIADNIDRDQMVSVTTSGSTGTPFTTLQDKRKKDRNYADTLFYAGLAGYKPGHRLIYLKIWVEQKMKSRKLYRLQNFIPVDVIKFIDREIGELINQVESDHSTFGILGYASALEAICKFLDYRGSTPIKANVKSVIAISETLNHYTRDGIGRHFGIPVVSRYSNLENGIIAQQLCGDDSLRYLLNTASYNAEILKLDSDEAAADGELGRIVVTDLFNFAVPMIRYDTGDIGALERDEFNRERQFLSVVEGRKLDLLYDTSGNLISSYLVYKNMWQYTEIDQYQLIQETKTRYTFKINIRVPFTKERMLIDEFKSFLGRDADFRIEYVTEIPLLASGKRKKIVSRLNDSRN